jgi:hypothetical protein
MLLTSTLLPRAFIPTAVAASRPLRGLWDRTLNLLEPLGLTPVSVTKTAGRWRVGDVADCRMVYAAGRGSEALLTAIIPADPAEVPVFAAELLAAGGCPQLGFADLRVPGTRPDRVAEALALTRRASDDIDPPDADEPPPAWAADYSPGAYLFCRPNHPADFPALADGYAAYLDAWVEMAFTAGPATGRGRDVLADYKRDYAANSPGRAFLANLLGRELAGQAFAWLLG